MKSIFGFYANDSNPANYIFVKYENYAQLREIKVGCLLVWSICYLTHQKYVSFFFIFKHTKKKTMLEKWFDELLCVNEIYRVGLVIFKELPLEGFYFLAAYR